MKGRDLLKRVCRRLFGSLISCALLAASGAAWGQIEVNSSPNTVGSGARALGMGRAFIAVADDATAASWNPGGLTQLERPEISLVYNWNWAIVPSLFFRTDAETGAIIPHLLSQGLMVTLRLTFYASIAAALIGLVIGLCRIAPGLLLRLIGRGYVELIRNVPPLVFIFVFYFFLSSQIMPALGIADVARNLPEDQRWWFELLLGDRRMIEAFLSGAIVLVMFEGAYVAEIIRGGLQSIAKGQWEAAASLGLSRLDRMRDIILPQAIRNTAPPLANQFISLVKDSSIVSLIAIQELTFMASQTVVTTQKTFEIWLTIGAIYFAICWPLSLAFRRLERRSGAG